MIQCSSSQIRIQSTRICGHEHPILCKMNLMRSVFIMYMLCFIFTEPAHKQYGRYSPSSFYSTTPTYGSYDQSNNNGQIGGSDQYDDDNEGYRDADNDTDLENSCSMGESHTIIDASSSCCNHNIVLVHGLDLRKFWNECARPLRQNGSRPNDMMEDYVNSTRRVYACILSKSLGDSTVNLLSFADLMTARYPAEVRSRIMMNIKNLNETKDYRIYEHERIRNIRNKYFEVQSKVCSDMDIKRRHHYDSSTRKYSHETINTSGSLDKCDEYEEAEHNGGTCCRGQSVPLDLDYWRPPAWKTRLCNITLAEQFRRWRIRAVDIDAALEICGDACQLQPEGPKGAKFLETIKLNDFRDVSAQIRNFLPRHFSQYMVGVVQNYSRQHYNTLVNENDMMKNYGIDMETARALKSCVSIRKLSDTIFDALHNYCFSSDKRDVRIQSQRKNHG